MAERRTRRRFTREYKAQAVQRVIESGRPLADIAAGSRPRFAYGRTWLRRSLLRNTTAPEASAPWTWKTLFARSKPIVLTCPMDASLEWCSTPPLWHTKAVGGRPHGVIAGASRPIVPTVSEPAWRRLLLFRS